MSPDAVNGNPPSATKRKKNRDKKAPHPDFSTRYMPTMDMTTYYSFLNCSTPNEPMSLPSYHYPQLYPNYSTPNHSPILPSNEEYLSLPVVNVESELGQRRFSDPGPNDSDESTDSLEQKVVEKLASQVQALRESNKRLTRDVMEMRIELNMLKQQNSRHFERDYEPGMLADIIREVRDAARVREDALLARVKHMIEEKQHSMNHLQLMGDNSNKSRISNNDRIAKLEDQLKALNVSQRSEEVVTTCEDGNAARQVLELEREALELRRELQDTRAKKEEADQKVLQLDRKLSTILKRNDSDEDSKTNSMDTVSVTSSISQAIPRVTLSGPVTDL